MQYEVLHITHFEYDAPIRESVMEVRMRPRTDALQKCYAFTLNVEPAVQIFSYVDGEDNVVHHFDIPTPHEALKLEARALVEVKPPPELPLSLPPSAWEEVDRRFEHEEEWEMVMPSAYARSTPALEELAARLRIERRDDPLSLLLELNTDLFETFTYKPQSTRVNSPIDDALRARAGVCQDFAHIFIALVRRLEIPCRYVSGYLYHRKESDRSAEDGSHAWAEAFLPELGWVGFDPTNNMLAGDRHIRIAVGRDYADVPPTRGVFRGNASSKLHVGVRVSPAEIPAHEEIKLTLASVIQSIVEEAEERIQQRRYQQGQQ